MGAAIPFMRWEYDQARYSTMRCMAVTDTEDDPPGYRVRPMSDHPEDDHRSDTEAAPPMSAIDREAETSPEASAQPLTRAQTITPPPPMPDSDELATSALASREPPEWFRSSYIGQALSKFSSEAKATAEAAAEMRENRAAREAFEQSQAEIQRQILESIQRAEASVQRAEEHQKANFKIVHEELRALKASDLRHDGRLAEGDARFKRIEESVAAVRSEMLAALPVAVAEALAPYIERIEVLEQELRNARAAQNSPAKPA